MDVSSWGKYGQWGHLEYLNQDPNAAVKWRFIRDWPAEMAGLRPVDQPLGAVPQFVTAAKLATAIYGEPYTQDIAVTNGNGTLTLQVIDQLLADRSDDNERRRHAAAPARERHADERR